MIENKILEAGVLEVAVDNIQSLDHEQYALLRKDFFGASDSSILCEVNLYKNIDELLEEKNAKYLTKEEKEVGEKPIVKKGFDLEPITLDKAEAELGMEVFKPKDMYKFKNVDGLSVNYDGVCELPDGRLVPVEAKLVSKYGEKYYNKNVTIEDAKNLNMDIADENLANHIKKKAVRLGIPAYYYTQVQQEMAGLNAPFGYLAAMFDESWTFKLFLIPRDEYVINQIYARCKEYIGKVKRDTN